MTKTSIMIIHGPKLDPLVEENAPNLLGRTSHMPCDRRRNFLAPYILYFSHD